MQQRSYNNNRAAAAAAAATAYSCRRKAAKILREDPQMKLQWQAKSLFILNKLKKRRRKRRGVTGIDWLADPPVVVAVLRVYMQLLWGILEAEQMNKTNNTIN